MVKYLKLSKAAKKYRFIATKSTQEIAAVFKQKYERLAPVLEDYREMLGGEQVSHTTFRFNSEIDVDVAFSLIDQKMQASFNNSYNKYVRSEISSLLDAARTMMCVVYKASFLSRTYVFDVIMANEKLRMYFSSLYHWLYYNEYYELSAKWIQVFSHTEYPSVDNLPRTTKLLKKIIKMFEGMELQEQLKGRFHDVLTSSASGQLESEKVYITIDIAQMIQCSEHTSTTWRSCYGMGKEYPYSAIYMATHPDTAMIYTVDSEGRKTYRTWLFLHPKGVALNQEAWPNNSQASKTITRSIFNQMKKALSENVPGSYVENGSLTSSNYDVTTPHYVYTQFAQGGHRSNLAYYDTTSDFHSRHDRFYGNVPTHTLFRFNTGTTASRSTMSILDRQPLTPEQLSVMKKLEELLEKFNETGTFGPSQLVLMLQEMNPQALEFFLDGIRNQYGNELVDAALHEAFPDTYPAPEEDTPIEEVTLEEAEEDNPTPVEDPVVDTQAQEQELAADDLAWEFPTDAVAQTITELSNEGEIPTEAMPGLTGTTVTIDPVTGRAYSVTDPSHSMITLQPSTHFRVEGEPSNYSVIVETILRDARFGALPLIATYDTADTVEAEAVLATTFSTDTEGVLYMNTEGEVINSGQDALDALDDIDDETREQLEMVYDEVYIEETIDIQDDILSERDGESNE